MSLRVKHLRSGGLITNYHCPSACAHCLYACGPGRPRDYLSRDGAARLLGLIRRMGCDSVHIGGGEPLLDPAGLSEVLAAAAESGEGIEYVETNSAWFRDLDSAVELLAGLRGRGMPALLVSLSPFHNEAIPFRQVKGVMEACRRAGVRVLPWVMDFYDELESLGDERPHALAEFRERFGGDYLRNLPRRYWVHLGGRAAYTFAGVYGLSPLADVLARSGPCRELVNTSHFHVDLYGNYVPELCAGLAFPADLLGKTLPEDEYPLLNLLYSQGVAGLLDLARERAGFRPAEGYLNKCHLCLEIRRYLASGPEPCPELAPAGFYEAL